VNHIPMPNALIITTAGTNCDLELAQAFETAGAEVESLHLNAILKNPERIEDYDLIGLPGGFSYGDAIAAGRIKAQLMRRHLYQPLVRAIQRGTPIIAPCNGFQVLAQMGLLPGPMEGEPWPETPPTPTIALAQNEAARFVDCWSRMKIPPQTNCIWTKGLNLDEETGLMPSAHGERAVHGRGSGIDFGVGRAGADCGLLCGGMTTPTGQREILQASVTPPGWCWD